VDCATTPAKGAAKYVLMSEVKPNFVMHGAMKRGVKRYKQADVCVVSFALRLQAQQKNHTLAHA
jgi:hypothetical protein